jgi:hypothetical protein
VQKDAKKAEKEAIMATDLTALSDDLERLLGIEHQWPLEVFLEHFFRSTLGSGFNEVPLPIPATLVVVILAVQVLAATSLRRQETLLRFAAAWGFVAFWATSAATMYLFVNAFARGDARTWTVMAFLAVSGGLLAQAVCGLTTSAIGVWVLRPRWSGAWLLFVATCAALLVGLNYIGLSSGPALAAWRELREPGTSPDRALAIFRAHGDNRYLMRELARRPNLPAEVESGLRVRWPEAWQVARQTMNLPAASTLTPIDATAAHGSDTSTSKDAPRPATTPGWSARSQISFATTAPGGSAAGRLSEVSVFEDKIIVLLRPESLKVGTYDFRFSVLDPSGRAYFTSRPVAFSVASTPPQVWGWFRFADTDKAPEGSWLVQAFVGDTLWDQASLTVHHRVVTRGSGHYIVELTEVPKSEPVLSNLQVSTQMDPQRKTPLNEWSELVPSTRDFLVYTQWSRLAADRAYRYRIELLDPRDRVINRGDLRMRNQESRWGFWTRHQLPSQAKSGETYRLRVYLDDRLWATRPLRLAEGAEPVSLPADPTTEARAPSASVLPVSTSDPGVAK